MAKQIFAVTSGSYSDYRVNALFSTRAKAQAFIDAVKDSDINSIEAYDLDPPVADLMGRGYVPWHVRMKRNGDVLSTSSEASVYRVESANRTEVNLWGAVNEAQTLVVVCWAKSSDAAIKIANEKRAELIASGKWDVIRKK